MSDEFGMSENSVPHSATDMTKLTEVQRKRVELQLRIHKARTLAPAHIPLRIFRDPEECVEAGEILDRLQATGSGH
jgi:hypothetical protein